MNDSNPASAPAIDIARGIEQDRQYAALIKSVRPVNKAALFDALARAGITTVAITFDGYGDSGQIETVEAKTGDAVLALPDGQVEIARVHWDSPDIGPGVRRSPLAIRDAVEELAYDFLEDTHCGWEDGDGAYGEFVFDVTARTITVAYNERHMESDYTEHVF